MGIEFLELIARILGRDDARRGQHAGRRHLHGGAHVVLGESLGSISSAFTRARAAWRSASRSTPPTAVGRLGHRHRQSAGRSCWPHLCTHEIEISDEQAAGSRPCA
jgi:hypothetical protein